MGVYHGSHLTGASLRGPIKDKTMNESSCVFDATRPVALQLRGPDGLKTVPIRFPSDEEWIERQRRRKVIIK